MATYIGIGFSREPNTSQAARDAALQAKAQTKQSLVDIVFVLTTGHYSSLETLRIIRQTFNQTKVVGCSTAGIILSASIEMRGIAVLAIGSQDIKFGIGCAENINAGNMRLAGAELTRTTALDFGQHRRQLFIILADGLMANYSPLISGAQEILGKVFPIVGAGSSDYFRFKETRQYFQDKPSTNAAVAVLMGGQMRVGVGSKHGWKPLGKPRSAEQTEGNIIKTIDGKRASTIYEEYFAMNLKELLSSQNAQTTCLYPLGIYLEGESEYLLRNAVQIREDGSIVCQGEVPQGSEIHLMISTKDFCKEAAAKAVEEVKDSLAGKQPKLIIIFESLTRNKLLGRGAMDEIQLIKDLLGSTTPLIGMYSYGEIAPLKSLNRLGEAHLQNETITILGII